MSFAEIFILSLALAADAFTVGAAVGLRHRGARQVFRLSFHFGLFQALMPLLGLLAGGVFIDFIADWDHWVVLVVLSLIGVRMIAEAFKSESDTVDPNLDYTRRFHLVGLSLAVSIDALGAGVGLAAARAPVALSVVTIGVVATAATVVAMLLADRISRTVGRWSAAVGGLALIGVGVKMFVDHIR